jgi:hypothetical protein
VGGGENLNGQDTSKVRRSERFQIDDIAADGELRTGSAADEGSGNRPFLATEQQRMLSETQAARGEFWRSL